jgi:RNA polymerase sigma-70 factor (ECF subfamily)
MRSIYMRHWGLLYTLALGLLRDGGLAEDAVQDVFASLERPLKALEIRSSLRNDLATCVCNRAKSIIRGSDRRKVIERKVAGHRALAASPKSVLSTQESIDSLKIALTRVTAEQREILLLRCKAGLSYREIVEHLSITVGAAKTCFHRGKEALERLLNAGGA